MKLASFTGYTEDGPDETVYVNPAEVAAVIPWRYHSFRSSIAKIILDNGKELKVWQNAETVVKRLNEAMP